MSQRTPSHWRAMRAQLAEHGLLQRRVAVVELAACPASRRSRGRARRPGRAPRPRPDAAVVLGLRGELLLRPAHEEVRVLAHPGVVRRHVVGDEVEDQPQAATLQAHAQPGERRRPRRSPRGPGSPRTAKQEPQTSSSRKSGRTPAVLGEPLGVRPRDAPRPPRRSARRRGTRRGRTRPRPAGRARRRGCRRGSPGVRARPASSDEPDPRVDLEERGISRRGHGSPWSCVVLAHVVSAHLLPDHAGLELLPWRLERVLRRSPVRRCRGGVRRGRSSRSGGSPRCRPRCRRGSTRRRGRGRASAGRPGTSRRRRRPAGGRSRRAGRCSRAAGEISFATSKSVIRSPGAGRALDLEVVAVEARTGSGGARTISPLTGIQIGPRQFELPPNIPVSDSPGRYSTRYSWPPAWKTNGCSRW